MRYSEVLAFPHNAFRNTLCRHARNTLGRPAIHRIHCIGNILDAKSSMLKLRIKLVKRKM